MKEISGNYGSKTQNFAKLDKILIAHKTSSDLSVNQNEMLIGKIAQYNQLLNVSIINNLKSACKPDEIQITPGFEKSDHRLCSSKALLYTTFKSKDLSGSCLYMPLYYVYYDLDSTNYSNKERIFGIINKNSVCSRLRENPVETSYRSTIYHHSMNVRKLVPSDVMYRSNGSTSSINRPTVPYCLDQLPIYLSSRLNFKKNVHVCNNCYMRQSNSTNCEFQPMIVHDMPYLQANNSFLSLLFIKLKRFTKLIQKISKSEKIVCFKGFKSCGIKKSMLSDHKQKDVKFYADDKSKTMKSQNSIKQ
ncbi:unnamed protein product [Schistosoma margrebowiei]|uniref:Uncharacterized protein n=1 Tax=Schistosoma margrebowiei TaxID=48269 RepID=A0AA85A9Y3_9TREM|nr:unnamed protein product [Schistosoma margrebowiei]